MRRTLHKLSTKAITEQRQPGYYGDGGNLYLQVSEAGTKSWVFRYTLRGRPKTEDHSKDSVEMGLGSLLNVSIRDARAKAAEYRGLLANRIDPVTARDQGRAQVALEAAKSITFSECCKRYIEAQESDWKNPKHVKQWRNTLRDYCEAKFGSVPVQDIDTPHVLSALEPIWTEIPETARRVRGRIESVLDWAKVRTYRSGENPARWRGHLDKLLPKKRKPPEHLAALPFDQIGSFVVELREQPGIAARALEFAIFTAGRTGEVTGALWKEIDMDAAVWVIPGARMKAGREHRVPLSAPAMAVLRKLEAVRRGDLVFPGSKEGKPLSDMAMSMVLRRMGRAGITVHGMRSSFRNWAARCTSYPREICELSLAHTVGTAVERSYMRDDLLERRRPLMEDWARHCETVKPAGEVVSLKRKEGVSA